MLITIARFTTPIAANLARIRLQSAGIDCALADEYSAGAIPHYSNAIGGIRLQVLAELELEARAALAAEPELLVPQFEVDSSELADEGVNIKQPKTDSAVKIISAFILIILGLSGFIAPLITSQEESKFLKNGIAAEAKPISGTYMVVRRDGLATKSIPVTYLADGEVIYSSVKSSASVIKAFETGKTVKIVYAKDNPVDAIEVRDDNYAKPLVFSLACMMAGLFLLFYKRKIKC